MSQVQTISPRSNVTTNVAETNETKTQNITGPLARHSVAKNLHGIANNIASTHSTNGKLGATSSHGLPFDPKGFDNMNQGELEFMFMSLLEYLHSLLQKYKESGSSDALQAQIKAVYAALKKITSEKNFTTNPSDTAKAELRLLQTQIPDFSNGATDTTEETFMNNWSNTNPDTDILHGNITKWLQDQDMWDAVNSVSDFNSTLGKDLGMGMLLFYISMGSDSAWFHGSAGTSIDYFFNNFRASAFGPNGILETLMQFFYHQDGGTSDNFDLSAWKAAQSDLQCFFNLLPTPYSHSGDYPPGVTKSWPETYAAIKAFLDSGVVPTPPSDPDHPDYNDPNQVWYLLLKDPDWFEDFSDLINNGEHPHQPTTVQ